jgi:hypothetical protein
MKTMPSKLVCLALILLCPVFVFTGYEIHRARVALEETRDAARETRDVLSSMKPAPQPAKCPASVSHLDHDVDLGTLHECADGPGVQCVTYQGEDITAQLADARCKAGKL